MPKIPEQFKPNIEKKEITSDEYQRRLERLKTMGRVIGEDFEKNYNLTFRFIVNIVNFRILQRLQYG
ncbi:hypothetical protein J7J41_02285 [bacterium]|nr:hypothetical protein [bacterium]